MAEFTRIDMLCTIACAILHYLRFIYGRIYSTMFVADVDSVKCSSYLENVTLVVERCKQCRARCGMDQARFADSFRKK